MAKKGRGRKFRKYLRGSLDEIFPLGALAAETVIALNTGGSVTEKAWLSSVKATWTMDEFTPAVDQGPIVVGVAHSDYTAAEIEEWIEQSASWDTGNLVAQEVSKRKIRQIGAFESPRGAGAVQIAALKEGAMITTKCGWMLNSGDGIAMWAYNSGSAALTVTEPNVKVNGHANLWPA